ncbi:hypothetical protein QR680_009881 [Steinernema hermaphroditum]|uniref:lysoplasmalogenase n=1 Tax=Steinernema hermaphroditum TaxID=289476 RepID=A0AA39MA83_9BILA|nr:hypothetical protein QR680_009881 [Steinernema hermaphroditum]
MIRPEAALGNAFEELSIDIQDELADESRTKIDLDSLPRNSVEITAEFASACRELKSGQLVLSAGFGLGEAMAAIEIMEPKMDAGMKKVDLDNLNLEEMVRTKQINVENMPQNEMIATMDCTIAALASWLNGRSADETLFTNILLQDWRCIEDFTLRAFCKGIIQVFKLFSEVITDAGTFYEEDFVVPYYADIYLDTTGCVIDLVREVHRLNRMIDGKEKNGKSKDLKAKVMPVPTELTCIRDRLELVLQFINVVKYFIGFEPTEYGNSLPCASIFSGCTKTDNFRPNFAQAFESAKKGGVLVLLMSTTYKQFGLNPRKDQRKQENGASYEWLPAFNPDLNRMDVPAVFPRKRNLLSRHEGFKYFTQLFNLLLNIPSHQNALPELNHFLNNVRTYSSWKESCVLSRSFLQMVVRPKEQLVFGRYDMKDIIYQNMRAGVPLKYMVDDKTDSGHRRDVAFLIDTFVAGASECFVSIVKMYGHNKERRREIISTLLNDLEILAEEASRCDTITTAYLMEREEAMDPKEVMEEVIPSLYDFVMNYTFSLIQYHFLLGFELDLFDAHEYPYLFWYTSQITTLWRDVISHRRHQLLDTDEKLNDLLRYSVSDVSNGGKKKKRKDRSPKEHQLTTQENGEATLRKYNLDYMGQQIAKKTVAGDFYVAVIKALIALKETKEFFTPPGERRRFNERVKWFQAVPEVAHLTYDAYSSFVRPVRPSHNDRKQLLSEAAGAFKKFADGELASTMKELAICSKKNWIALNLLADDPTREVVYNFKNGAFDVILLLGKTTFLLLVGIPYTLIIGLFCWQTNGFNSSLPGYSLWKSLPCLFLGVSVFFGATMIREKERCVQAYGLLFGVLGDFFLGLSDWGLVPGTVAFGIAHLCYLGTFAHRIKKPSIPLAIGVAVYGVALNRLCLKPLIGTHPLLSGVLLLYSLILSACVIISGSMCLKGSTDQEAGHWFLLTWSACAITVFERASVRIDRDSKRN